MVARHGARALTSPTDPKYVEQLIAFAVADNALTDLGSNLLSQVQSLEAANVAIGYGNLSGLGVEEHQELATRLLARMPALFNSAVALGRQVMVMTSGKDRAVDSAKNFAASLGAGLPALVPLIEPAVTNPGLLYFFKLNAAYQDWLANDPTLSAKLDSIFYSARSHREAQQMLRRAFTTSFVDKLAAGAFAFKDPKTGNSVTLNEVDLAVSLYDLYQIAPGLSQEGTWDFARFVPEGPARWFAYVNDAEEFYQKGPSFAGSTITFAMAQVLQDDFFNQMAANCIQSGPLAADLRFAHAETVIPLAALMELPGSEKQAPIAATYRYDNNPWRGAWVSPYAANIQWDGFTNDRGDCLVRMLYEEKQTRFKTLCKTIRPDSFFYQLSELRRCYGY